MPEVILARRLALRVAAIAVVTSFGAGFAGGNPTPGETRQQALSGLFSLRRLIRAFLKTKDEGWSVGLRRDEIANPADARVLIQEINRQAVNSVKEFEAAAGKIKKEENAVLLVNRQGNSIFIVINP